MTGRPSRWPCKRRPTAKRITLRVSNATGEVVLTIPERTDLDIAQRFADSHGDWIATRLAKVPDRVDLRARRRSCPCAAYHTGSSTGRTSGA